MSYVGAPFDSLADDLERLADAVAGQETDISNQDKIRTAVKRLADYYEDNPGGGGGLTLYGPYIFTNSIDATLTQNESSSVDLDKIYSSDKQTEYQITPELMENIIFIPYCSNAGNSFASFRCITVPDLYGTTVIPMSIFLLYIGDENNKTVYSESCEVVVYTNVELPVVDDNGGDDET